MKSEATIHSKMGRLARCLGVEHWGAIGLLEALWKLTAREAPAGDIGKLSNEDIAYGIWWKGDSDKLISALDECGWIDPSEEHRLVIHDWFDHAEDSVHVKLAKSHKLFADGKIPKLTKLSKNERGAIEKELERIKAQESAYQTKPNLPIPNQTVPAVVEQQLPEKQEPKPISSTVQEAPKQFREVKPALMRNSGVEARLSDYGEAGPEEIAMLVTREQYQDWPAACSCSMAEWEAQQQIILWPTPEAFTDQVRASASAYKKYCAENPTATRIQMHVFYKHGDYRRTNFESLKPSIRKHGRNTYLDVSSEQEAA